MHMCILMRMACALHVHRYDRIILSDLDLCMAEDPLPWLRRHAAAHFLAFNEMAKLRGYRGINCHLALLHPSELMARLVLEHAPHACTHNTCILTCMACAWHV